MSAGYVYILINSSMPGLIKVGRTYRDSKARARELHSTGVPTPFEVAFELFSEDHEVLELKLQKQISDFRVSENREFFKYPLSRAIQHLQKLSTPLKDPSSTYYAKNIFHSLTERYKTWLKPSIIDVRIVQTQERVWLEITEEEEMAGYLVDQIIIRNDLTLCSGDDLQGRHFSPNDSVSSNAIKFIQTWDPYSIIMTTDLFRQDACEKIDNDPIFNPHLPHIDFHRT
jgi:hypothetical protein